MNLDSPARRAFSAGLKGALVLLTALLHGGCVSRTLTIESEPAGAEVMIDGRSVGITPVTVPFRYGGQREVILLAAGYRPGVILHDSERFWLDTPPFDAAADLITREDSQHLRVPLVPEESLTQWDADKESVMRQLRERAAALRARAEAAVLEAAPREPLPPRARRNRPRQPARTEPGPELIR